NSPGGFGSSAVSAGDVNGDGYGDVTVGTDDPFLKGPSQVYVYHGSASGLGSAPALTLTGPSPDDNRFGISVAGADYNGDGYSDIAVGVRNTFAGKPGHVYVYAGGPGGLGVLPVATLVEPEIGGLFGHSVSSGDFNADGYADLVVGAFG